MQYVYIFIGGALGALLRYLISFLNTDGGFPIGTLIANLTGAFVMGLLTALTIEFFSNHPTLKKAITTGFLGALTTFSTLAKELTLMMTPKFDIKLFLNYSLLQFIIGFIACYIGYHI